MLPMGTTCVGVPSAESTDALVSVGWQFSESWFAVRSYVGFSVSFVAGSDTSVLVSYVSSVVVDSITGALTVLISNV